MIWLIVVQTQWINNALIVQEKEFVNAVNKSLFLIIAEIEKRETVMEITNETVSLTSDSTTLRTRDDFFQDLYYRPEKKKNEGVFIVDGKEELWKIEENPDSAVTKYSRSEMKDFLADKISKKTVFVEKILNKLIRKEVKIEDRLSPKILKEQIDKVFRKNDVNKPYKFAVRNEKQEISIQSPGFDINAVEKVYEIQLFPNDVLSSPNFLVVYFEKDIIGSHSLIPKMAFTSVILTLIISLTFSFTVYIVFKQRKLSEIKNDFINNMTHELKTPISTISLAAQMLKDTTISISPERLTSISRIIDDESKRLGFQVEKVLQTSIFEKGGIKLKFVPVDVHELIHAAVLNTKLKVKSKGGTIEDFLNAKNPTVNVDEMHFTNVIYNLIDNAIKYSKDEPQIRIETVNTQKGIIIKISDNGIGISKEHQKKVFEKFFRVPKGNVHDVKGFGLGLNYVKKIIDEHNAIIKVQSELGKGTTFQITLNVAEQES